MPKYTVINRSPHQISIVVPAHHRKNSISLMLETSRSIDLVPYAGSIEECRRIAYLKDLHTRGFLEIIEEADGE